MGRRDGGTRGRVSEGRRGEERKDRTHHLHVVHDERPLPLGIDVRLLGALLVLCVPGQTRDRRNENLFPVQLDDGELLRVVLLQRGEDPLLEVGVGRDEGADVGEDVVDCVSEGRKGQWVRAKGGRGGGGTHPRPVGIVGGRRTRLGGVLQAWPSCVRLVVRWRSEME